MVTPTKKEIEKKASDLEGHMKFLTPDGRMKEGKAMSMVKSSIRQTWMRAPNKLAVLEMARTPDMNPATRTKWLFKCAACEGMFKLSDIQIDHIVGNHSFKVPSDFQSYWDNILNVPISGLQVLCATDKGASGCHPIKTYMEKVGCTWQEAVDKKVIIKHCNWPVKEQKEYLKMGGFKLTQTNNATNREKCWTQLYESGMIT
jgi:hypothetical protein